MIGSPGFEQNLPLWMRVVLVGVALLVTAYLAFDWYRHRDH